MLHRVESLKTPLIRQMDGLARQLTLFILLLAAGTFAIAFLLPERLKGAARPVAAE